MIVGDADDPLGARRATAPQRRCIGRPVQPLHARHRRDLRPGPALARHRRRRRAADARRRSGARAAGWRRATTSGSRSISRTGAAQPRSRTVALAELRAAGARPRRRLITGAGALTPCERRIAELAAAGRQNRAIAESLVVTLATVEYPPAQRLPQARDHGSHPTRPGARRRRSCVGASCNVVVSGAPLGQPLGGRDIDGVVARIGAASGCRGSAPRARPRCARCPRPRRPPARRAASARSRAGRRALPRSTSRTSAGRRSPAACVCAATTPGSAADRPAPAMITRRPRSFAFFA